MKNRQYYFLLAGTLFFFSTFGFFWLSELHVGLAIVSVFFLFFYFFRQLPKNVYSALFFVPFLILSYSSISMQVRDITYEKKCFVFNVSYPTTESYDKCVESLNTSDYLETVVTL